MSYYNYSSTLFSGFSTSGTGSFQSWIGEYANIKNGTYKRLLKSYYEKYNADGTAKTDTSSSNKTTSSSKSVYASATNSAKALTNVSDKASELQSAATKLANSKDEVTLESVKSLVSAYNATLDATAKVTASSVIQKVDWVQDLGLQNKDALAEVGITFDSENRMQLDEIRFQGIEVKSAQKVFEGTNSFAGQLARKASNLAGAAEVQATKAASSYSADGSSYSSDSLNSGSLFDSLF